MTLDPSRARCKPLQRKPDHARHGVTRAVSAHGALVDFKRTRCTSLCQSSEGKRITESGGGHGVGQRGVASRFRTDCQELVFLAAATASFALSSR